MAMMAGRSDPYQTLGVSPSASELELRAAYRRLVQRHHPDHNNGSPESARRFEEVQEAYAEVRRLRAAGGGAHARSDTGPSRAAAAGGATRSANPDLEARLAEMERDLKAARDARERAAREARQAQEQALREADAGARRERPTDEELGYYSTDDSFSKILDDAATELSERWSEARRSPVAHRVSDLIDELADKLTGEPPPKR
jgi:DnaJ-class molecular chaperone